MKKIQGWFFKLVITKSFTLKAVIKKEKVAFQYKLSWKALYYIEQTLDFLIYPVIRKTNETFNLFRNTMGIFISISIEFNEDININIMVALSHYFRNLWAIYLFPHCFFYFVVKSVLNAKNFFINQFLDV